MKNICLKTLVHVLKTQVRRMSYGVGGVYCKYLLIVYGCIKPQFLPLRLAEKTCIILPFSVGPNKIYKTRSDIDEKEDKVCGGRFYF